MYKFNPFTGTFDQVSAPLSIGSSIVIGGTSGSVLFIGSGGVLQQDNANFFWDDTNNQLRTPKIVGGTTTTSDLIFQTTTAIPVSGADMLFLTGNDGATQAMVVAFNGEVGIGGAVDSGSTLTVQTLGSTSQGLYIRGSASQASGLFVLANSSDSNIVHSGSGLAGSAFGFNEGSLDIDFRINGSGVSNLFYLNAGTNTVGIGVNDAAELLELENSAATTGIQISNAALDGDPFLAFALSGTKTFTMGVDDGDSDKFKIGTTAIGTSTRLTIDASGNVGIATAVPQSLLDVQGPVGTGATSAGILTLATKELTIVSGDQLGRINFNAPLESAGGDAILAGAAIWAEADATFSATVNNTELVFGTATTSAAVERMRIDSAGNVGIGTATPGGFFELNLPTALGGTAGNALLMANMIGNAGSSVSNLQFRQYRSVTGSDHDSAEFRMQRRIDTTYMGYIAFTGISGFGGIQRTTVLGFNDTPQLIIMGTTGDIGIGTIAPAAKLDIDQDATAAAVPVLRLDQADVSEEMIEFETTIGTGNAIEAVGAKTLSVTHFIKITLPGALTRYIAAGTIA